MASANTAALLNAFQGLRLCASTSLRQVRSQVIGQSRTSRASTRLPKQHAVRAFSTTSPVSGTWLEPSLNRKKKMAKGRPRVATGGSTKGTTVIWGDYGLRMVDHHRRISAKHLKMAEDTIKVRLRGEKYRLYKRKCCNVGVYVSGNEVRIAHREPLSNSLADRRTRCVWEKERVPSIIGRQEWLLAKFCLKFAAESMSKSSVMRSAWRAISSLVNGSL